MTDRQTDRRMVVWMNEHPWFRSYFWHTWTYCSGPCCSKLMTSLVNNTLKFTSSDMQIFWNILLKKCISLNVNFNESLINDAVSFEQLGPVLLFQQRILPRGKRSVQINIFLIHPHKHMLCVLIRSISIMKTRLFKYTENFTTKNRKFSDKNSDIFQISAQNIDCGYSLELPLRDSSNEYPQFIFLIRNKKNNVYPCKPKFYHIKVGFKGVKII